MVYIQMAKPIRDFNKIRIKEIHFFDTDVINIEKAFGFKYQIYKMDKDKYIKYEEKHISISDRMIVNKILTGSSSLGAYDYICRQLLQYLIDESIEFGTLELKK